MRSKLRLTREQAERRERGLRILARMIARAYLASLREQDARPAAGRDRPGTPAAGNGGKAADHGR